MEDLKYITYQDHDLDQSEEAWETFLAVGFQRRKKLTNQRAPNEANGPALTTNNNKGNTHDQTVIRKFQMTPEMAPDDKHTQLTYSILFI